MSATAIPSSADSLLVLTASEGGEMATGIFTSLVDYNPPSIVPLSLQCADTDPTIGVYSGFCTVRRPESEGGVTAYEIFWGRNATHTLPGASSLGRAELNASSGELVTAIIETTPINPAATHLVALAAGPGGVQDFKYTAGFSKFRPGRIFKPRRKSVDFSRAARHLRCGSVWHRSPCDG